MENIKAIKRGFIVILTLCILLGIGGICAHATVMAEETTIATEETKVVTEESTVEAENTTQELMPMMASRCDDYWAGQPYNAKSVSTSYLIQNGVNPHDLKYEVLGAGANISLYNIYKDSNGGLWLYSGSGSYIPTYTYI